jgi:polysaccharide pyruvyl transferase WcaK-like protein
MRKMKQDVINFFLCERIPSENRGEAAILEGFVAGLKEAFGPYELTIYSMRLKYDEPYYRQFGRVVGIDDDFIVTKAYKRTRLTLQLLINSLLKRYFNFDYPFKDPLYRCFADADVLLQGHDNVYRHKIKIKDALVAFFARQYKKILVIPAASIGPFEVSSKFKEKITMSVLESADLITLRDPQSKIFLDKIGLNRPVSVLTDLAFLLPPEKVSKPWPDGKLTIGFTPTTYVFQSARLSNKGKSSGDLILAEMRSWLSWLVTEKKCHLVFIPHVFGPEEKQDDRMLIKKILEGSNLPIDNITIIDNHHYSAGQLKYLIGSLDMLIACRTHSLIAALGQGTPVLALTDTNRYKTNGILGDLFTMPDCLYYMEEWSQGSIRARTAEAIENIVSLKNRVEHNKDKAKKLALENINLLRKTVNQKSGLR